MPAKLTIMLFLLLPFVLPACSYDKEAAAEDTRDYGFYMLIQNDVYPNRKMGPVKFTHDAHFDDYGLSCDECHHDYVDGKNVWTEWDDVRPCVSCHAPDKHQGNVYKLATSYHKSCRTCHHMVNEPGDEEYAPFRCYSCHERKAD